MCVCMYLHSMYLRSMYVCMFVHSSTVVCFELSSSAYILVKRERDSVSVCMYV